MSPRFSIIVGLAAIIVGGMVYSALSQSQAIQVHDRQLLAAFNSWKQAFGKLYATPAEQQYRMSVFRDQLSFVEQSNADYEKYLAANNKSISGPMFEMNAFGDLTNEEFTSMYTGVSPVDSDLMVQPEDEEADISIPEKSKVSLGQAAFDPRIRQQGSCGSCWAFSAVVEVERVLFDFQQQYVDLSQQELVDCVSGSNGCKGGHPEYAFDYVKKNGIRPASMYPYRAAKGYCNNAMGGGYSFPDFKQAQFKGFSVARSQASAKGGFMPAVMVYADGKFRYLSKVNDAYDARASGECGRPVTHAVTQSTFDDGMVLIINSWGSSWGYKGYKWIVPCAKDNLWGEGGRLVNPYGI